MLSKLNDVRRKGTVTLISFLVPSPSYGDLDCLISTTWLIEAQLSWIPKRPLRTI